jgi:hypothetical protein
LPRWARERQTSRTRSATMVHAGWGRRRFLLATSAALDTKGRTIIARAQPRHGRSSRASPNVRCRRAAPWRPHAVSDRRRGSKARRDRYAPPHDLGIA